jgi:RNA 2',3'-cyclic 3'-phosphodiesterase
MAQRQSATTQTAMISESLNETARLFFALWPDETERAALAAWQPSLHELCGGRVIHADMLHATLVFLGEVELSRLEALQLAAQEVNGKAFRLTFDAARYWGHNHIVYAASGDEPSHLMQLVRDLNLSLRKHHFHFDKRPYQSHVTLLRNARWGEQPLPAMHRVAWQVREFVLVQSLSDKQGTSYQVLAQFPLH